MSFSVFILCFLLCDNLLIAIWLTYWVNCIEIFLFVCIFLEWKICLVTWCRQKVYVTTAMFVFGWLHEYWSSENKNDISLLFRDVYLSVRSFCPVCMSLSSDSLINHLLMVILFKSSSNDLNCCVDAGPFLLLGICWQLDTLSCQYLQYSLFPLYLLILVCSLLQL